MAMAMAMPIATARSVTEPATPATFWSDLGLPDQFARHNGLGTTPPKGSTYAQLPFVRPGADRRQQRLRVVAAKTGADHGTALYEARKSAKRPRGQLEEVGAYANKTAKLRLRFDLYGPNAIYLMEESDDEGGADRHSRQDIARTASSVSTSGSSSSDCADDMSRTRCENDLILTDQGWRLANTRPRTGSRATRMKRDTAAMARPMTQWLNEAREIVASCSARQNPRRPRGRHAAGGATRRNAGGPRAKSATRASRQPKVSAALDSEQVRAVCPGESPNGRSEAEAETMVTPRRYGCSTVDDAGDRGPICTPPLAMASDVDDDPFAAWFGCGSDSGSQPSAPVSFGERHFDRAGPWPALQAGTQIDDRVWPPSSAAAASTHPQYGTGWEAPVAHPEVAAASAQGPCQAAWPSSGARHCDYRQSTFESWFSNWRQADPLPSQGAAC